MNNSSPRDRCLWSGCMESSRWWMSLDIWELPTDVALLDNFSTKPGESVITVEAHRPHVRELECERERISEYLINVLWLNNIRNWLATASLLFLLWEELRHSSVLFIYLKAAWPNPISPRKLHDIICARKSILPNIRSSDVWQDNQNTLWLNDKLWKTNVLSNKVMNE